MLPLSNKPANQFHIPLRRLAEMVRDTKSVFALLLVLFMAADYTMAQPKGSSVPWDKPGSLGSVSDFNGSLNIGIPLVKVGGRGDTEVPLVLRVGQYPWKKYTYTQINPNSPSPTAYSSKVCNFFQYFDGAGTPFGCDLGSTNPTPLLRFTILSLNKEKDPGYGPGLLVGTTQVSKSTSCISAIQGQLPTVKATFATITRYTMSFITPDGQSHELVDKATYGRFREDTRENFICNDSWQSTDPDVTFTRGKEFVSTDGSAITFVSDREYTYPDPANMNLVNVDSLDKPDGYMYLPDGSTHRVAGGLIQWSRDRNGNLTTFEYVEGRLTRAVDSIGRKVTLEYDVSEAAPYGVCDRITYNGFAGQPRVLRVSKANLGDSDILRANLSLQTPNQMWPGVDCSGTCGGNGDLFNPQVVSRLWLPDGRSYKFQYNSFAEVARVELPTGGALEYDHDYGINYGNYTWITPLTRQVKVRRLYLNNSSGSLVSETAYDRVVGSTGTEVTISDKDKVGNLLALKKRYYHGSAYFFPVQLPSPPVYGLEMTSNKYGEEQKTEHLSTDGQATVLRSVENTYQNKNVPWLGANQQAVAPAFDLRLTQILTKLHDSNQVTKQTFVYDDFNNVTDTYEYHYGDNQSGLLARHTHTDYANADNLVNGVDYSSNAIHLRRLPVRQQIFDGNAATAAVPRSLTTYEYDNYTLDDGNDPGASKKHAPLFNYTDIIRLCTWINPAGQCVNSNPADNSDASGYKTRGNLTAVTRNLLSDAGTVTGSVTSYSQFDVAGNVIKAVDARGNSSKIKYQDNYGSPDGVALTNSPPPELVQAGNLVSYAFPTEMTNSAGHVSRAQYDYHLGAQVKAQDPNGVISSTSYNDPLDRPKQSIRAVGTTQANQTTINYQDSFRTVTVTSDLSSYNDNLLKTETVYDGLGRTTDSRSYENATDYIRTKQTYDALGRVGSVTNPYRTAGDPTYGVATSVYDALGRVKTVTTSDGAYAQTDYDGTKVMVTDQAGRKRVSETNALGQVTDVWEIKPADSATVAVAFGGQTLAGYLTHYDYDTLGNLKQVTQSTQMPRSFAYDSLSRLTSATNPEGGTIQYQYDANGNLVLKIDPRPRQGSLTLSACSIPYTGGQTATCYKYDSLNRVEARTYNDGTPNVTYAYDTAANGTGRLASVSSSVSAYSYTAYDALGRVRGSSQTTDGVTYSMPDYQYNLAGGLTSEQYPSGRVVKTDYDAAGRVAGVKNQATGLYYAGAAATDLANSIQYAPSGAASVVKLGNGLWEHTNFNSRLQPKQIGLGATAADSGKLKLDYAYGVMAANGTLDVTKNNGNLQSQTITVPGSATPLIQTYVYDELNRLKSAEEKAGAASNWKQIFSYDPYGNRNFAAGTTAPDYSQTPNDPATGLPTDPVRNPVIDPATNRIKVTASGQGDYRYDEAGNLLCQPGRLCVQGQGTLTPYYAYDADNRMKSAAGGYDNGGTSYIYDGDGRRVKKASSNGEVTVFVYDAAGRVVAEYSTQVQHKGTRYLTQDYLGSTRVVSDAQGNTHSNGGSGGARHDYLPFGEEIGAGVEGRTTNQGYSQFDGVRHRYTSKERDDETGLDFFGARYYSSVQGRFTSVDPVKLTAERLLDPQRLNLYEYCLNNPLKYVDPDGEDLVLANAGAVARFRQVVAPGLTRAERRNLRIAGNRVQLRNPNFRGSSPAYGHLKQVITTPGLTVNYYSLASGQAVTTANGQAVTYQDAVTNGGLTIGPAGGSGVQDVVVPVGGARPVAGMPAGSGNTTPTPEDVVFAHEAYGHALGNDAVQIENDYRASRNPILPARSGEDHRHDVTVTVQPDAIQPEVVPLATQITPEPLIPLPPPPPR